MKHSTHAAGPVPAAYWGATRGPRNPDQAGRKVNQRAAAGSQAVETQAGDNQAVAVAAGNRPVGRIRVVRVVVLAGHIRRLNQRRTGLSAVAADMRTGPHR